MLRSIESSSANRGNSLEAVLTIASRKMIGISTKTSNHSAVPLFTDLTAMTCESVRDVEV